MELLDQVREFVGARHEGHDGVEQVSDVPDLIVHTARHTRAVASLQTHARVDRPSAVCEVVFAVKRRILGHRAKPLTGLPELLQSSHPVITERFVLAVTVRVTFTQLTVSAGLLQRHSFRCLLERDFQFFVELVFWVSILLDYVLDLLIQIASSDLRLLILLAARRFELLGSPRGC